MTAITAPTICETCGSPAKSKEQSWGGTWVWCSKFPKCKWNWSSSPRQALPQAPSSIGAPMGRDARIEKMHETKVQLSKDTGLSAKIGGLMHDATALVVAKGITEGETAEQVVERIGVLVTALYKKSIEIQQEVSAHE